MTFVIRNIRGRSLLSFDNEARARAALAEMEKRTKGAKFELYRVRQVEELVA